VANVGVVAHQVVPQAKAPVEPTWRNSDMTLIFRTTLSKKEHNNTYRLIQALGNQEKEKNRNGKTKSPHRK